MLKPGDPAPDFTLQADDGREVSLRDFRGKKVVLYFYPKDNTPGCTREANSFNEKFEELTRRGIVVLGVSRDSVKSHQKFKEKYGLKFPLLSDPEGKVCEMYGVLGEKKRFGRTYIGIFRTTFLIGEDGNILHVFEKVKPDNHATEVLQKLEELGKL
ncbi:MAG TPA: thioredoxin-dependent thiol peroxidase [Bacteroidetes bacterium]|nr:thioredoxin-dependent thiol peroxidase [Bacteroidota bacterium]